jgi:ABC-type lipoprotein export system ATPase subunit
MAERTAGPVVELRSVGKTYRGGGEDVVALHDVSLALWEGDLVVVIGRSGSGKTTLLSVAAGWEAPDAGALLWEGHALEPSKVDWAHLAVVPQGLGLLGEFTLRENVEYPLRFTRHDAGDVDGLLTRLGIDRVANRYPQQTSLGEQQRAAVARALVLRPPVVLLDEPTSHLDTARAKTVFQELVDAADRGTACLIATHARDLIAHATRVIVMRDGRLQEPSDARP